MYGDLKYRNKVIENNVENLVLMFTFVHEVKQHWVPNDCKSA